MEIILGLVFFIGCIIVWKYTNSITWISIFILFYTFTGTYIVDYFREQNILAAYQSTKKTQRCGTYVGHSTIERGRKHNRWLQTIFHFQDSNGQKYNLPESDNLSTSGEHYLLLENPPQSICLIYAEDHVDRYGYPILIEIKFNRNDK